MIAATVVLAGLGLRAGAVSPIRPSPADSIPIQGVWRTEGYGLAIRVTGKDLQAFEITAISCLPAMTATVAKVAGSAIEFAAGGNVFVVSPAAENQLRVHFEGAASDMMARRMAALPEACGRPPENTPLANFDIFARTFAEHYILFGQKHVDWAAATAVARKKVSATTTPAELFAILSGLITPLEDAHTSLAVPGEPALRYHGARRGTDSLMRGGGENLLRVEVPRAFAGTDRRLMGPLRSWCNGQVWSGRFDDSTGYLRLLSFSGYSKEPGFRAELTALETALDSVLVPGLKRLVIDVRINMGGADPLGLAIASRLTATEYLAYSKEARADPENPEVWTPGQPSRVLPSPKWRFTGPVAVLTSGLTISAGETFTQALMGRRPAVYRVGEATQGVFSDVLGRRLPNGMRFGLPNEVFRSPEGRTFDGPGIPPTHPVAVFTAADRRDGRDQALEKALELLATHP